MTELEVSESGLYPRRGRRETHLQAELGYGVHDQHDTASYQGHSNLRVVPIREP